ncbi:MAG: hypothetical protein ABI699_11980 [Caldimonas sp.]
MRTQPTDARPDAMRRKLMLALPGSLALASPLALVGCGGGGDAALVAADDPAGVGLDLPPFQRSVAPVRVRLPAGVSIALAGTSVMTGNNASAVAADGTAGAVMLEEAPVMAYLFGADGRLLLMGVIEVGRPMLDSRSTAEALLYIASEAATLEPALQIAFRQVLQTHAVVEPLRVAVEASLGRGGIDAGDAALMSALGAAQAVIRPAPIAAASGRAHPLSLKIQPVDQISGITVKRDPAFNTVVFENAFRRRAYAWVDRVGHFDQDGKQVLLPTPVPLKDFDISATTSLSFDNLVVKVGDYLVELAQDIGVIGAYQQGTGPFRPVASEPVYLQLVPEEAQASLYRTRIVGIGALDVGQLSAVESAKLDRLRVQTMVEDILIPVLKTMVLPIIGEKIGAKFADDTKRLFAAAVVNDLYDLPVLSNLFPNTMTALKNNDGAGVWRALWPELVTSATWGKVLDAFLVASYKGTGSVSALLLPPVFDGSGALVGVTGDAASVQANVEKLKAGLSKVARMVTIAKALATVGDVVAIAHDWSESQGLTVFDLTSSGSTLDFTPRDVSAVAGGSVPLTVVLGDAPPADSDSLVGYEWTVSGAAGGTLRNQQNGSMATTMSTSGNSVDYVAAAGAALGAIDRVTVKAILKDRNSRAGNVIAVQKVPATVTIGTMKLTPESADMDLGGGQRQEFTITFAQGSGDGFEFEWSCASLNGAISDGTHDTSSGPTTFRSKLPTVYYASNGKALGGETELVSVRVLRITSAPGAAQETSETVATLAAPVRYPRMTVKLSPGQTQDIPTDIDFGVYASLTSALPNKAELTWVWEVSGVGTIQDLPSFSIGGGGAALFSSGTVEGSATLTVRARIFVPGTPNRTTTTDPASVTLNVRKGMTKVVMEVFGGVFGCNIVAACGVDSYSGFLVPKFKKAVGYEITITELNVGHPYYDSLNPPNTYRRSWINEVGDGGGIYFPITHHPHGLGAEGTKFWCVWTGFGGAVNGKATATITLAP